MKSISDLVGEIDQSEAFFIQPEDAAGVDAFELVGALNKRDYHAIVIDRAPVINKETLMHALYQNLRFPGWFGFTWDSLKDVLTGIDGDRGKGFVFAFGDLSQLDADDRCDLLEVIEEANEVREEHEELERLRVLALKV